MDRGDAEAALLVRPTPIDHVLETARRGETMPQKIDLLLSQAALRPSLPAAVTDWLEICRAATEDVKGVLERLPTRLEREPVVGDGEGGDETTAIDDAAELAVVERLDELGGDFTLVSEELGLRPASGDSAVTVVLDPIDGSINAKRGIPFFSLSIAVADGPTMSDVHFGYVYDFGAGEEWAAVLGEGATLDGAPLDAPPPKETIELLSLEATKTHLVARAVAESRRRCRAPADHGLARSLALPLRRRPCGRCLLAPPCALGRHRCRAARRSGSGA